MKKSIRKITSLLLTLVLTLLTFAPATVSAVIPGEDSASAGISGSSGSVLYHVSGAQASANLRQSLDKYNIAVDSDTSIDVVSTSAENGSQILVVTDVDGETMTKSVIMALDENGDINTVSLPERSAASTAGYAGDEIEFIANDSFVVVWAIQCIQGVKTGYYYYQPMYAEMIYYNNGGHTVEKAEMVIECSGIELTYPGLAIITGDEFVFDTMKISATKSNKYFVCTQGYRSDRVIWVCQGCFVAEFDFKINGRTYNQIVDMFIYRNELAGS